MFNFPRHELLYLAILHNVAIVVLHFRVRLHQLSSFHIFQYYIPQPSLETVSDVKGYFNGENIGRFVIVYITENINQSRFG